MASSRNCNPGAESSLPVAAAIFGASVGGPLGAAVSPWLANIILRPAPELACALEKTAAVSAERLLQERDGSFATLVKLSSIDLRAIYRDALRRSFWQLHDQLGRGDFDDWFENWEFSLADTGPLALPALSPNQFVPEILNGLFEQSVLFLDAQGKAIRKRAAFRQKDHRTLPPDLLTILSTRIPELFQQNFSLLITVPTRQREWMKAVRLFELAVLATQDQKIPATNPVLSLALSGSVNQELVHDGSRQSLRLHGGLPAGAAFQVASGVAEGWQEKYMNFTASPEFDELLATEGFEGTILAIEHRIESQTSELARRYFELGTIRDLRFDWKNALKSYRDAWRLERNAGFGFRYAHLAVRMKHFAEAIAVYESLCESLSDSADVAVTHDILERLYGESKRWDEAEKNCYDGLAICRTLAEGDPEVYLPELATSLDRLGTLQSGRERCEAAERAFGEALVIRRKLATDNPRNYLAEVATTLNNRAILFSGLRRDSDAERDFGEALEIRRKLAHSDPGSLLPEVAATLGSRAQLYSDMGQAEKAAESYTEAATLLRPFCLAEPAHFGDLMARILSGRAQLCEILGESIADACSYLLRALNAAVDDEIKRNIQQLLNQLSGNSSPF